MTKLKKLIATMLVVVMASATLVGCSGSSEESAKTETSAVTEESNTAKSNVTITVMAPQDQVKEVEQFQLAEKFKEETGITIDFQISPADQYDSLLSTKLNSDTCADIFLSQSGALNIESRYNPEKNCVDLSNEEWASRLNSTVKDACSLNGKLYGMTIWNVDAVWAMVYNKQIFAEHGLEVPTTYEEFKAVCETLKAAGITPIYECVADAWHPVCSLIEMFVDIEKENPGTYEKLNNNEIKIADIPEALTLVKQFKEIGQNYQGDAYMSNEFAAAAAEMANGNYAMVVNRPAFALEIEQNFPDATYGSADDFGAFVIPYLDNSVRNINPQGPTRFIYSGSEHIEECKLYLNFLAENMQTFIDEEPTFTSLPFDGTTPNLSNVENEFFAKYEETGAVMQAAVSYVDPQWMDIAKDVQSLYIDEITPEDFLANIDARRAEQAKQVGDPAWE